MRRLTVVAGIICSCLFFASAQQPAKDFTLKDLSGADVTLSSFKGKVIVIDFWATWCHACKEAFPELNAISEEYADKDVVVLGVNLEKISKEKVAAFAKKVGIKYTILPDSKSSLAKPYEIKGVPSLAIVDKNFNVVKMFRGLSSSSKKEIQETLESLTK